LQGHLITKMIATELSDREGNKKKIEKKK